MKTTALVALPFLLVPAIAQAQTGPGSGTDLYRVNRAVQEMMQDGRYQRLLQEQQANREAFERLRQRDAEPTAVGSVAPRRRR